MFIYFFQGGPWRVVCERPNFSIANEYVNIKAFDWIGDCGLTTSPADHVQLYWIVLRNTGPDIEHNAPAPERFVRSTWATQICQATLVP